VTQQRKQSALGSPTPSQNIPLQVSVPSVDRQQLLQEISSNQWRFGFSQDRLLNPDELIGRKGMREYRRMMSDDQVKAAMALKRHAILSSNWDIEPASDSAQDIEVADFCRWVFRQMDGSLLDDLNEILSALVYGYSISELVFRPISSGPFKDKVGLRALKTRLPDEFIFRVDAHDNLLENGIEQFGKRMPTWKFVIFSASKEFDNWYGTSDLRAAYRSWWLKDFVLKAWGMFLDRYSVPLALGTYPPSGGGVDDSQIQAFRTALENLQLATTMTMPNDYKVDFPAVGAQGSGVFALAIERQDQAIARAILVPSLMGLSPQGTTGSYSQAKKQFDVFLLVIEKLQDDLAESVMGEQIIKRVVDLNYRVEEYPKFIFLPFTETNKAELLTLWFQALAAGSVTSRPEDEVHIRMVAEFPEVSLEELQQAAEDAKAVAAQDTAPLSNPEAEDESVPQGEQEDSQASRESEISDEELDALIDTVLRSEKKMSFLPHPYASGWNESEHPRDEDGQFTIKGSGTSGERGQSLEEVFHGTALKNIGSIFKRGIIPGYQRAWPESRSDSVYAALDFETAANFGHAVAEQKKSTTVIFKAVMDKSHAKVDIHAITGRRYSSIPPTAIRSYAIALAKNAHQFPPQDTSYWEWHDAKTHRIIQYAFFDKEEIIFIPVNLD
jgi:phage gp29-like protein